MGIYDGADLEANKAAGVYRLTRQDWGPGEGGTYADWNHYIHDTHSWTATGGDWTVDDPDFVAYDLIFDGAARWIDPIDLTEMAQDAMSDRGEELDIILRRINEVSTNFGRNIYGAMGSTEEPYLRVTYTPAVVGGDILTLSGIEWANVKKASGVLEASISKVSGVAAN